VKKINLTIILFLLINIVLVCRDYKLKELVNPYSIFVHKNFIYIIDGPEILIYSLKNFELKKRFGSKGEGPGSFMIFPGVASLSLTCHKGRIQINSMGKISYFTLDGNFIKELKHSVLYGGGQFWPVKNKYVAMGFKFKNNKASSTIDIYNQNLEKENEILEFPISTSYDGTILDKTIAIQTTDCKIFVLSSNLFVIDVFNVQGKKIFNIYKKYENLKFKKEHKNKILEFYQKNTVTKNYFPQFKDQLKYPSHLPAIKRIIVADKELYVQTYFKKENKSEFFVFNFNGNQLRRVMLPIKQDDLMDEYFLFFIRNHELYQLIEDNDQVWHLKILKID